MHKLPRGCASLLSLPSYALKHDAGQLIMGWPVE